MFQMNYLYPHQISLNIKSFANNASLKTLKKKLPAIDRNLQEL